MMRCLAHISDLHFGTEEPGLEAGLLRDLEVHSPSLIAITGDFTQRARHGQYRKARRFLDQLPSPWIAVPGNHDVPLYDVLRRFLSPLGRYRRYISDDLDPFHQDGELMLLGLNTARSLTWKSGRISVRQLSVLRSRMGGGSQNCFKIVMTHHPFIPPAGDEVSGIDLVGRAALAIPVLDECRIDLLLAGHLHRGYTGNIATYYPAARPIISVQAGTAISRRRREQANAYNLLTFDRDTIQVDLRLWRAGRFEPGQRVRYVSKGGKWTLIENKTVLD